MRDRTVLSDDRRMRFLDWEYNLTPRSGPQFLSIDDGQVFCPQHGEIDVERCFTCAHMRSIRSESDPAVECDFPLDTAPMIGVGPVDR